MKPFTTIAVVVFALVAIAHLIRLVNGFEVTIAGTTLARWPSVVGMIVGGILSVMLWREARR